MTNDEPGDVELISDSDVEVDARGGLDSKAGLDSEAPTDVAIPSDVEPRGKTAGGKATSHYVVGIGASAGGIEALREVLPVLPVGNVSYVIAQHMSAAHPSLLTQVLARETSMPVIEVEDGMAIHAGVIYVAPPNRDIEFTDAGFVARQAAPRISPQPSIDVLLESLALTYGSHAVGIVLSGTGSDGARGMAAIKAGRGFTIVQDPSNARYRDMPTATIEAGAADYVAEATEIGPLLAAIIRGETELPLRASGRWVDDPVMASIARETKRITGWDISAYKDGTLGRQLSKRVGCWVWIPRRNTTTTSSKTPTRSSSCATRC